MSEQVLTTAAVEELARDFRGELIGPAHPAYDQARAVWNGMIDRRPALIARCTCNADVIAAVGFARENGLPVAVRGGGHSACGHSTCDAGLVIDLSPMKAIRVDTAARTARAEAGMTWGDFDAATQQHGLAVTGGRFSTTGIAGLTLGSGSGWLERKCGLTADNLIAAEVVTADGRLVTASEDENEDLFWGLRGGGGNFGIVTAFTYRLHEIGPIIYGGMLVSLPDRAEAILRWMREEMPDAPEDLGMALGFVSAPPEPFVPAEMHFKPIVGTIVCWTGEHAEGERVLASLREVAQPVMDMVQPMPYTALQSMLDAGGPHGINAYMKAELLPELSDEAIATLILHASARPGPLVQLLLEPLGGAIAGVGEDDTALGRRDVPWCYHALSMWMDDGQDDTAAAHVTWAKELAAGMEPHTTPGVYLNFTSDEGEERVLSTYGPEKYARLVALKDDYDAENVFRLNQNIRPSAG
ncbi:MAG TPA: FAD-binding oxidoreductase [Solirubrobacteraceae bacterium]|nr:FAD-binding oxidoreductase [Solirubrobacteraceae bacterium]